MILLYYCNWVVRGKSIHHMLRTTYTRARAHANTHTRTDVHTHTRTLANTNTRPRTHTHTHVHTRTYAHTYPNMHTHIRTHVPTYPLTHLPTYTRTHAHTHKCKHANTHGLTHTHTQLIDIFNCYFIILINDTTHKFVYVIVKIENKLACTRSHTLVVSLPTAIWCISARNISIGSLYAYTLTKHKRTHIQTVKQPTYIIVCIVGGFGVTATALQAAADKLSNSTNVRKILVTFSDGEQITEADCSYEISNQLRSEGVTMYAVGELLHDD